MPESRPGDLAHPDAVRRSGVVLAFDFGRRRMGLATANMHTRTASPLTTLEVGRDLPWPELDRIIGEWQPGQLVVGTPRSSREGPIIERVREFVAALEQRYRLPVTTVDEAYSSRAARAELAQGRRSGYLRRRIRKGQLDAHAACLIAEQWLAEHGGTSVNGGGVPA